MAPVIRRSTSFVVAPVSYTHLDVYKRQKKERRARPRPALPCEVELSLQEALGTEVGVTYKEGKGTLQVHFYSDEQLKAFANLLGKYEKENGK